MVGLSEAQTDMSPLAQSRVQWTLVIGFVACFMILSFSLQTLSTSRPNVSPIDTSSRTIVLDLNLAKPHELALLPTIGPVLAERIVNDREQHGHFHCVDDLRRVSGIGPKTLMAITDYCRVTPIDRIALSEH